MAVEELNFQLNALCKSLDGILQHVFGTKYYSDLKQFATHHPFVLTGIISISLFSAIPFLFFLGFAVVTLFIALLCFLCIEGSIIAIGGLIFVGIVSFIAVIVGTIVSALAAAFWILQRARHAFKIASRTHSSKLTENDSRDSSIEEISEELAAAAKM